jgi:hypothetical protein
MEIKFFILKNGKTEEAIFIICGAALALHA